MTEPQLLDDELKTLRDGFEQGMPELWQTVNEAIEEIEAATVGKALDVGATAPDFERRDVTNDRSTSLSEVLAKGPAVVSFYRGEW